jgi:uncharacterized protein YdeI (YjbR/CyaY-like superfamily)
MASSLKPVYFPDAAALRRWFSRHAAKKTVLLVGFMKKTTGIASVTWPQAVDEALCVGWIDGVRHRIDEDRYTIRFSPRRPGSRWSHINIRRVAALKKAGRMKAAGLAAFAARKRSKFAPTWYEQKSPARLSRAQVLEFKRHAVAWKYYRTLPPGYRKMVNWWITNAKKPETRARRLSILIDACAQGRRLDWAAKPV